MTSCSILQNDCKSEYTATNLKISENSPFVISAGLSVLPGYTETACVKCENGFQEVYHKDLEVTQRGKCLQSLSKVEKTPEFTALDYSEINQNKVISSDWQSFFINSDQENCPMTKCILMDESCD